MNEQSPQMLKPTLIAGVSFGVASAIPFVNFLNCCTICGFVWGSGLLAAYLYSNQCKMAGVAFSAGGGATVGLIAGAFYAITSTVVGAIVGMLMPRPDVGQIIEQVEEAGGEVPPWALEMIENFAGPMTAGSFFISFFFVLLIAAIFSTLGGVIGGAVFKNEPQAGDPGAGAPPA